MSPKLLGFTLISFLMTYKGIHFLLPNLRKSFLQEPNIRSSHFIAKPAGGGLSFVFTITLLLFFLNDSLPLICLPLSIVGFFDDKFYVLNPLRCLKYFSFELKKLIERFQRPFFSFLDEDYSDQN